jgi:hypothetical protein
MTGPRLNGASNDPDDYGTPQEPRPDAEDADSDTGSGEDDDRELGGEAKAEALMS